MGVWHVVNVSFLGGSGPSIAGAPDPKAAAEIAKAMEAANKKTQDDVKKAIEDANKASEAAKAGTALAATKAPDTKDPAAKPEAHDTKPDPKEAAKSDKPLAEAKPEKGDESAAKPDKAPEKAPDPKPAETNAKPDRAPPPPIADRTAEPAADGARPVPRVSTPYRDYAMRRDAIEKALQEDPLLLKRVKGLSDKYEAYHKTVYGIVKKYAENKKKKSEPGLDRPYDRQRDIEVFEKTSPMINELYEKIFR
jgi:hypothetical protein